MSLDVWTLTDGGQPAEAVAERLVAFLGDARSSLDLALYDIRLPGAVGDTVAGALREAVARGVAGVVEAARARAGDGRRARPRQALDPVAAGLTP